MKRKLVKQGQATLMVSLPQSFVKRFNLKKGDEVDLTETENKVIVAGKGKHEIKKISLDLTKANERVITWAISASHKKGYDEITLHYKDEKVIKLVEKLVKNLMR